MENKNEAKDRRSTPYRWVVMCLCCLSTVLKINFILQLSLNNNIIFIILAWIILLYGHSRSIT